jgi:hypothetical protein
MSTDPSLDQESFQTFLANAYVVQQSGIDAHSLAAFIKLQRSIAAGESDVDEAMRLVADAARDVADATGVAIALLEAGQLVYRAGSGSGATDIGRHVTAVLSVSAQNVRGEILRVEDAQADSRIQAEVCRQFGGKSLLVLPICRENALEGVLEIHFREAHIFQDREVRAYRLMAGLVEEAMSRDGQPGQQKAPMMLPAAVSHAVEQMASFCNDKSVAGAAAAMSEELPALYPPPVAPTEITPQVKRAFLARLSLVNLPLANLPFSNLWRNAATAAAVSVLVIANWIAYHHHPRTSITGPEALTSNAGPESPSTALKPSPANHFSNQISAARRSSGTPHSFARSNTKGALPGFKRIRVGKNEVDYVADDVTMRLFTPAPKKSRTQNWSRQVNIGDDVTVRYFALQPTPVSAAAPAAERSMTVSK